MIHEAQSDKVRFKRMLNQNNRCIKGILHTEKVNRTEMDNFFLRMHLKTNVPFFQNFESHVMQNLFNKLDTYHFKKDDIIERKGDDSDLMYIVLIGKVGIYNDSQLKTSAYEVQENEVFGM